MGKRILRGVCLFLILLTVGFIFYNSAQPVKASNTQSAKVAETIGGKPKSEYEDPADWRAFFLHVRKAAHAIEFFTLGLELSFLLLVLLKRTSLLQTAWNILSAALAVAVTDESIQILSGRGARVQDVLLDFCGAAVAAAAVFLLYGAVYLWRRRKPAHEQ